MQNSIIYHADTAKNEITWLKNVANAIVRRKNDRMKNQPPKTKCENRFTLSTLLRQILHGKHELEGRKFGQQTQKIQNWKA